MNLAAENVHVSRGGRILLDQVSLSLVPGELHVLLGPNGAGKSTLLELLAGLGPPDRGQVILNGRAIESWNPRLRACLRAVQSQIDVLQTDFSASDVVRLGRYPCWRQTAQAEQATIDDALRRTDAADFSDRRYAGLSGGEKRRVQLSRALAQVSGPLPPPIAGLPRYLLLDEPTANLDLAHQHSSLALARDLAKAGYGVLAILHDPDLAMLYADRVSLLSEGRCLAQGPPLDVLTPDLLQQVYRIPIQLQQLSNGHRPAIIARP